MNLNMKRNFKEGIQTNEKKREYLLKLLKVILVLEQIISNYQELLQNFTKNNQVKINNFKSKLNL